MDDRRLRKDAARNRAAVLTAADTLFADAENPGGLTMADIAAAAGVGKGTLFRAFGDRAGLILALFAAKSEPLWVAIAEGPPPLGPATPPMERVPALIDAIVRFKLDNRHLSLALEDDSPYTSGNYERWHDLLNGELGRIPGLADPDFTAHALLAATRADLMEHLAGAEHLPSEQIRTRLASYTAKLLATAGA